MEIVIGAAPRLSNHGRSKKTCANGVVEAKLLDMRYPRRSFGRPPVGQNERRGGGGSPDPLSGRVMTVLIPDGYSIPPDAKSNNYKILLRFVPTGRGD